MGGACSTYVEEERCIEGFRGIREKDHLEEAGIVGRILLG
jgi:hypothetical protein